MTSQNADGERGAPTGNPVRLRWWQRGWWIALAALLATLPLLGTALPPLVDLPGHIGRYRIVAEAGTGPLAHYYAVHPSLIGNLGVDLLVRALGPLLDVEQAAHLVVALLPALTVAAMLWLAQVAHGRIPATAAFALPLAYALPFQLGFVNFTAAAALAILGLALWIWLAGRHADRVRIVLFVPYAGLVWLCHSFGWAMLGIFVLGAEWVVQRQRGRSAPRAVIRALLACTPMAWPQLLSIASGTTPSGDTGDWFDLAAKAQWIASMLRERWKPYDVACVIVLAVLLWAAVRRQRLAFAPVLGVPAMLGLAAFVLLPRLYAGGAYVDMRLLPYAVALAVLAIRTDIAGGWLADRLALAGAGFFALRTTTSVIAFALFARDQQAELRALPFLPIGASVLTLVDEPISSAWDNRRLAHIAGIAIARRHVFTNEQWAIAGQQWIEPLNPHAAPFDRDPSQLIEPPHGTEPVIDFDRVVATFDRRAFGYVWTIGFPRGRAHAADLLPVWSNDRSALYRVVRDGHRP